MGFFRIFPSKDNWITTKLNSVDIPSTGSNHGADPVLSVFANKSNTPSGSELGRVLIQFPITELSGRMFLDRTIPSASVSYILKMFDMLHGDSTPTSYDLFVYPLSRSWDEGTGVELSALDVGYSSWMSASSTTGWINSGSDFITGSFSASQHFDRGSEDLEVDVTSIVNAWLTGNLINNGVVVKLGTIEETNTTDYFIKEFHGRESKFIDKLPYIEARYSNVIKDNRNNFAFNQNNNLYLYNFVRGELTNINPPIYVKLQDHISGGVGGSASYQQVFTASLVETGIYSCSIFVSNTASFSGSVFYDIWYSGSYALMTGNFKPSALTSSATDQYSDFTVSVNNLRQTYSVSEESRFKVNIRKRNYRTHVGVLKSASFEMDREYIEKAYYSIENDETGEVIVPFGTGSTNPYTQLSYDGDGNYFNLFFNSFIPGFKYRIKFLIDINKYDKKIIDDGLIFKVV